MKRILLSFTLLALLVLAGMYVMSKGSVPVDAAKPSDPCAYIKGGAILDKFEDPIGLGYNQLGYNYEAHIFNGMYCDAYNNADWCQQFKDVSLMMKWNDAWLSNKDCGTQGPDQGAFSSITTPDKVLDRHYPSDSYIGSGAWLTNHATGTYTSATKFTFDVSGPWVVNVEYLGSDYPEDLILTQVGTSLTGVSLALVDTGASRWTITGGSVAGTAIEFYLSYDSNPSWTATFSGTIADDGSSMSGVWEDTTVGNRSGTWETTSGIAIKTFETCTVSDFVKIIAVPEGATFTVDSLKCPDFLGDGNKMWFTSDGQEIGCSIWGSFAIIQEIASDPCGEYGVIDYMSPLKKGLGNW